MNHESVAVGQVWSDRKSRKRYVLSILAGRWKPVDSVQDVKGVSYDVVWASRPAGKPHTTWCSQWEAWVNHATLIQEDS